MTPRKATLDQSAALNASCEEGFDALVAAATGGSMRTFEELVGCYRRMVLAIGQRMSGNASDAEDIAQQTFMKVFANLATFRKESSFSTWLISIARNEALMWKRKQSRRRELPMVGGVIEDHETPVTMEFPDYRPDPESYCLARERDALLHAEVARLQPEMQRALHCCDLQENSVYGAAQLLGVTLGAVKARRRRARLLLRTKLERRYSLARAGSTSLK